MSGVFSLRLLRDQIMSLVVFRMQFEYLNFATYGTTRLNAVLGSCTPARIATQTRHVFTLELSISPA